MDRLVAAGLAFVVALLIHTPSFAWSVATGSTDPCHEEFTGRAYENYPLDFASTSVPLPSGDTWRSLAEFLIGEMGINSDSLDEQQRFALVSLAVGARAPDTDGHSLFNMESLRNIHADPSAVGQYSHSLRGPDDDYASGDAAAVSGTRQVIIELVNEARDYLQMAPGDQIIRTEIYLDFYGLVDLQVWGPMFNIGFVSHVVQDTFSHTIRMEEGGFREIAHVMNYIDAIASDLNEERDGLAHSETFDQCFEEDLIPIVESADLAMESFFLAVSQQLNGSDVGAIESFLDEWVTLKQGCTFENDFCDNAYWLEIARRAQTSSYLGEIFGCSTVGPSTKSFSLFTVLFWYVCQIS